MAKLTISEAEQFIRDRVDDLCTRLRTIPDRMDCDEATKQALAEEIEARITAAGPEVEQVIRKMRLRALDA